MKSLPSARNIFPLPKRLKTEKFIKEQLWQLLLVVAFVALCAWILEKPVEATCFCVAHVVIRANFDKQYHSSVTRICLFITSLVVFFDILLCLPIGISLLSTIPIAFSVAFVGYLIAYKIEVEKEKSAARKIPFNTEVKRKVYSFEELLSLGLTNRQADLYIAKKRGIKGERLIDYMLNKGYDFSKSTYDREIKIVKNIMKDC